MYFLIGYEDTKSIGLALERKFFEKFEFKTDLCQGF
jgi:hypothetical protein